MTRILLFTIFDELKFGNGGGDGAGALASALTCQLNLLTIQFMLYLRHVDWSVCVCV